MVINYPPAPACRTATADRDHQHLVATSGSSSRTGNIPLGTPTCSARTRRGRWALYPNGDQVVVVWPGGALAGPPVEVARELNGLGGDHHDGLDHAAAQAIRRFLADPAATDAAVWSSTRTRTWSSPAVSYWLSGPANQPGHHTHTPARQPGAPTLATPIPLPGPSPEPAPARAA